MSLLTPTVTVTPAPATVTAVQAVAVTVAVTGSGATPTGSVKITSGAFASAAVPLTAGSAVIAIPPGALAVGVDALATAYTPDVNSDAVYTPGTGTANVTVTAVAVTPLKLQGYKAQLGYVPPAGGPMQILAGLKDLDGEFKADELDSSDHSGSWKGRMLGLLDFTATAKLDYIAGDPGQEAFLQALINRTPLQIYLFPAQGAGSGVDQYVGTVVIPSFKWSGKLKDLQDATFALANAANSGVTVAAQ
jgi:hypothetical protein